MDRHPACQIREKARQVGGGSLNLSVFKNARTVKSGGQYPCKKDSMQCAEHLSWTPDKRAGFFVSEQIQVDRWVKKNGVGNRVGMLQGLEIGLEIGFFGVEKRAIFLL